MDARLNVSSQNQFKQDTGLTKPCVGGIYSQQYHSYHLNFNHCSSFNIKYVFFLTWLPAQNDNKSETRWQMKQKSNQDSAGRGNE